MDAKMNVEDIIISYLTRTQEGDKPLSTDTKKAYMSDIKLFMGIAGIGYLSLPDVLKTIKENDVKKYLSHGDAPPRTQRRRWSSLSRFLEYCALEEITSSYPLNIELPEIGDDAPGFIIREEFNALMESEPYEPDNELSVYSHAKYKSMMSMIFLDGFKIPEILEKTYSEIKNTEFNEFTMEKIELYEETFFDTFDKNISEEPEKAFYRNKRGTRICNRHVRRNFSKMGKRVLRREDINPRTLHNGYMVEKIKKIRKESSEITDGNIATLIGSTKTTVRRLINASTSS